MLRFALCCAFYATIAAPRGANAFVVSYHRHKRTFSVELCETSPSTKTETAPETDSDVLDSVIASIDELYPPQGLDARIALSRKDGYWPFISTGEDPPQELVYGEFDVSFLAESLQKARALLPNKEDETIVFCDLGSGTGRLVLAAAALHPHWKLCKGIELLESIYEEARETVESCRQSPVTDGEDTINPSDIVQDPSGGDSAESPIPTPASEFALASKDGPPLPLAPIELECGSFTDPYSSFFDADILFCFSSCLPNNIRIDLARSIGRQCLPGTIVITTEYQLPSGGVLDPLPDDPDYPTGEYEIELVDSFSGNCNAVGGTSTVYIQRVLQSVGTGKPRVQPPLPVSEMAYRAIQALEDHDSTVFLRQVSNQMAFLGFPDSWRPQI